MNPEQVEGRVIFMSMFNGIDWTNNGNSEVCIWNSERVSDYAKKFQRGYWSFLGLGEDKNGMERATTNQKEGGTNKPIR